ncbi:putative RNA-directed DNA polymerase from transposon BS [Merluccius polli]|uniref:RNA-directed DNA polymerase from transposon BS n=1 Tax=Merluccius polli TaxID=89951 RepID=A0AA47MUH7_MERPO|nr:putative RNA-directed DNA polymerase from transposon BS [Merluccius polli]
MDPPSPRRHTAAIITASQGEQRTEGGRGRGYRDVVLEGEGYWDVGGASGMSLATDNGCLMAFSCSCVAGKGFCNHIVALLYQTAHYLQLGVKAVPPPLACTSDLQRWHRPRTQGIHPELVSDVVVRKPTTGGKSGIRSTLFQAYSGPFPDPDLMAAGAKLHEVQPQPLIALVLDGLSDILTLSKFGPVPHGSPLSYHCPPPLETSNDIILHQGIIYLTWTLCQHCTSNCTYTHCKCHHKWPMQQSKCPAWVQLRHPRLTASRFRETCASWEGKADPAAAAKALAGQMIRGSRKQTAAMTRGLQMESEVLTNYAEFMRVNVLSVGFVIPPEAPHLGASPDGRVYDPSESPPYGLVEVKSTTKHDTSQVAHLKRENGYVSLRQSHRYYWQVQGQLALTIKCRPFYLPREFTSIIISAVYIPPQADTVTALSELHEVLAGHQTTLRDAALIVAGDFNRANLKTVRPDLRQHITCATRGERTLDHCYSPFKDGYRAKSLPPFGKSDHAAILLIPKYKQRLKQEAPVRREVTRWSDQSEASLQDALDTADWEMFRRSSDNISEFAEAVLGFIEKLTNDCVTKHIVKTFPNQKPWVDKNIREALRARTAAYNAALTTGNKEEYKAASYNVRRAVKEAKQRYGKKLEVQLQQTDSRGLWKSLRKITDYKPKSTPIPNANTSFADELNIFYARFENTQAAETHHIPSTSEEVTFQVTEHEVRRVLKQVNPRKAAGPDGITGRVLRTCADQLAPVFTEIFNLSLSQCIIPTCFKCSTIVPVPKKPRPSCLNDYRPVALTPIIMKCFEKLIKPSITSSLPPTLDQLQFAYRPNRSTDDAIAHLLHSTLTHLDTGKGAYVRLLFIDYSSAFNTIVPSKLAQKLQDLCLCPSLCRWIHNFLTGRPQVVRVGDHTSSSLTLNTGAPQGCVLSPLLYSLYTYDCKAIADSNTIIKFADDAAVVGLISNNNEAAYHTEVVHLADWCRENHLELNTSKTKELIVDFSRKQQRSFLPLNINGAQVERVEHFRYLGITISQDLTWSHHLSSIVRKANQRLYHLRRLRDFKLPLRVLRNFYTHIVESILCGSITTWMGNTTRRDQLALGRVVRSAERTIMTTLPNLQDIYIMRCRTRARRIAQDPSHPNNRLFSLLPSGKRFRLLRAKTERLRRSFFPQALRLLNEG